MNWVREHPNVLVAAAAVGIGMSLLSLLESVDLYHQARQFVADLQRDASEALGG